MHAPLEIKLKVHLNFKLQCSKIGINPKGDEYFYKARYSFSTLSTKTFSTSNLSNTATSSAPCTVTKSFPFSYTSWTATYPVPKSKQDRNGHYTNSFSTMDRNQSVPIQGHGQHQTAKEKPISPACPLPFEMIMKIYKVHT